MGRSPLLLIFIPILLASKSSANILRTEVHPDEIVCDPAENPSSCAHNRQCEDNDGDGEYTCVCDKRFYTTHLTSGHCILGLKELVYDMEKELAVLEQKQEQDVDWLNETLVDLLELPTTTTPPPPPPPLDVLLLSGYQWPNIYLTLNKSIHCYVDQNSIGPPSKADNAAMLNGALMDFETPITCGGECSCAHGSPQGPNACNEWHAKCRSILDSTVYAELLTGKSRSASVQINPSTLWLTGGFCGSDASGNVDKDKVQSFTEYVSSKPGIQGPGPELPKPLAYHCVAKSGDKVYVISGKSNNDWSSDVYVYDFSKFPTVTGPENGPSLNLARKDFGCATLENGIIVVVGGISPAGFVDKSEILLPGASSWVELPKKLPSYWFEVPITTKGNAVYLTGGWNKWGGDDNKILKMECDDSGTCSDWEEIGTFRNKKRDHVSIWVPEAIVPTDCTPV